MQVCLPFGVHAAKSPVATHLLGFSPGLLSGTFSTVRRRVGSVSPIPPRDALQRPWGGNGCLQPADGRPLFHILNVSWGGRGGTDCELGRTRLFPGCVPEEPPPRKPLIKPGTEQPACEIGYSLLLLLFIEEGQFYKSELDQSKSFFENLLCKVYF